MLLRVDPLVNARRPIEIGLELGIDIAPHHQQPGPTCFAHRPLSPYETLLSGSQGLAAFDQRARAQQADPDPQSRNGAEGPAGAVAAGQAEQQSEREWAQERADLAKRQDAAGDRAGA